MRRADVIHQIAHTAGNGLPLGAEANLNWFKIMFLDVGICQNLLELDSEEYVEALLRSKNLSKLDLFTNLQALTGLTEKA